MNVATRNARITRFNLATGEVVAGKYEVLAPLGRGWEGEVYLIREKATNIERTAKLFFPHRNERGRALKFYARKLHKLRQCPIVIQYHTQDSFTYRGHKISFLVSEFVEGELLSDFLNRQPGRRLTPFQSLHLLHALASGIESIHAMGDYHGDLHTENIIVQRHGLGFDLKLLDMFHWGPPRTENIHHDVICLIHILYDAVGGQKHYAKLPPEIKFICCGRKQSLIVRKFRTAGKLRRYLENMEWS